LSTHKSCGGWLGGVCRWHICSSRAASDWCACHREGNKGVKDSDEAQAVKTAWRPAGGAKGACVTENKATCVQGGIRCHDIHLEGLKHIPYASIRSHMGTCRQIQAQQHQRVRHRGCVETSCWGEGPAGLAANNTRLCKPSLLNTLHTAQLHSCTASRLPAHWVKPHRSGVQVKVHMYTLCNKPGGLQSTAHHSQHRLYGHEHSSQISSPAQAVESS
jgi:hypothetical protein